MIDEIIIFYIAGMETIQVSSTNLIYYLTKHSEFREKLLKEILPPVELAKNDLINDLTYDTVMDFDYLQMCYNESLRIEPPGSASFVHSFNRDTEISFEGRKVTFKANTPFYIDYESIHHDPS